MLEATNTLGFVVPLKAYLASRGVCAEDVFGPVRTKWPDVDLDSIDDLDRRIPLELTCRILEAAAQATGDEAFGLKYAAAFPEGTSGLYGHVLLSAPTVRGMLDDGMKYVELSISPIDVGSRPEGRGAAYTVGLQQPGTVPLVQFGDFILAVLMQRIRRAAGPAWVPMRASFAHKRPSPPALDEFRRLFGWNLEFDGTSYEFAVSKEVLDLPNPAVLPGLRKTVLRAAERVLQEQRSQTSFEGRVKLTLLRNMRDDRLCKLVQVARDLGLSARTLQLRLKAESTTFQHVLADVREELAMELLRDSSLPLSVISTRLGFSEPSAFTRWASKKFEMPPSELRTRLRTKAAANLK